MNASEPKWVNSVFNIIGDNSLRLGGLQILVIVSSKFYENCVPEKIAKKCHFC